MFYRLRLRDLPYSGFGVEVYKLSTRYGGVKDDTDVQDSGGTVRMRVHSAAMLDLDMRPCPPCMDRLNAGAAHSPTISSLA